MHFSADGVTSVAVAGNKAGQADKQISLACLAQSNPPPRISWYRLMPDRRLAARGPNISFPVSRETEGQYLCEAKTGELPAATRHRPLTSL